MASRANPRWVGPVVVAVMLPATIALFIGIDALRAEPADTARAALGLGAFVVGAVIASVVPKLAGRSVPSRTAGRPQRVDVVSLLTANVPEIRAGVVHVVAVAREPGVRTKVALRSADPAVDPIRAALGVQGERLRAVVEAAHGERFDLVPWDEEAPRFVAAALAPIAIAKIVVDEERREMELVLEQPDDPRLDLQLRLAAELTGWRLRLVAKNV